MGSIRAKTSSSLLTRFGDRHRVCGSLRRDGHGIATICKRAKRAISYGRSKRLHLSNRHARTNAACSRHIDDCRHAIAVSYVTAAGSRAERRASDGGGHHVAARFNGPTSPSTISHRCEFNRGSYRLLENEWARDKHVGRAVAVKSFYNSAAIPFRRRRSMCGGQLAKRKANNFPMNDRRSAIAESESEKLLAGIGGLLMADDHYPSELTLLYAQVDRNVTGQPIFKDLGNTAGRKSHISSGQHLRGGIY